MLGIFSSPPFYTDNVRLPNEDTPTPDRIRNNPKFWPYFKDALGAVDGTHINAIVSAADRQAMRDRKGNITQNCLAICDFNLRFMYLFPGWEGSASDSTMYSDAHFVDLPVPRNKYYLGDAGFPICETLLVPYQDVWYHLAEWGCAQLRQVLCHLNPLFPLIIVPTV